MEFEPKQKNKVPDMAVLCLFLCAAVCFAFGNVRGIHGKGVLQLIALVFCCAMIFVLVKYKFTRIRYTIRKKAKKGYGDEDDDNDSDFAADPNAPITAYPPEALELYIESAQGKRTFIGENLVLLDRIVCFEKLPNVKSEKKALLKKYSKAQGYRYLKNPINAESWLLVADTEMGKVRILFEPNEKMANYLSAVAAYNNEKRKNNTDRD